MPVEMSTVIGMIALTLSMTGVAVALLFWMIAAAEARRAERMSRREKL